MQELQESDNTEVTEGNQGNAAENQDQNQDRDFEVLPENVKNAVYASYERSQERAPGEAPPELSAEEEIPIANPAVLSSYFNSSSESSVSSYTSASLRNWLFPTIAERNEAFGYDHLLLPPVQQNYNLFWKTPYTAGPSADVSTAPKDYYFNLPANPSRESVIGFVGMQPNLYNDNLLPLSTVPPNFWKSGELFSTTANPVPSGAYVRYIPHPPVEIAPNQTRAYWEADLNGRLYERSLINSAKENPYSNWYGRQGLINLLAENIRTQDPYLQPITGPCESIASQLQRCEPPAVTNLW
jgi:hypothetical protein